MDPMFCDPSTISEKDRTAILAVQKQVETLIRETVAGSTHPGIVVNALLNGAMQLVALNPSAAWRERQVETIAAAIPKVYQYQRTQAREHFAAAGMLGMVEAVEAKMAAKDAAKAPEPSPAAPADVVDVAFALKTNPSPAEREEYGIARDLVRNACDLCHKAEVRPHVAVAALANQIAAFIAAQRSEVRASAARKMAEVFGKIAQRHALKAGVPPAAANG